MSKRAGTSVSSPAAESPRGVRLDVWLWAARWFKTRNLAKQQVEGGKVSVNAAPCKPAKLLRVGDRVALTRGEERYEVDVLGVSERRGSATEAQAWYAELDSSRAAREAAREHRRFEGASRGPLKRPNKQDRRLIRGFKQSL
jgi:ribosome-associated heat shock protein Hsp15